MPRMQEHPIQPISGHPVPPTASHTPGKSQPPAFLVAPESQSAPRTGHTVRPRAPLGAIAAYRAYRLALLPLQPAHQLSFLLLLPLCVLFFFLLLFVSSVSVSSIFIYHICRV